MLINTNHDILPCSWLCKLLSKFADVSPKEIFGYKHVLWELGNTRRSLRKSQTTTTTTTTTMPPPPLPPHLIICPSMTISD